MMTGCKSKWVIEQPDGTQIKSMTHLPTVTNRGPAKNLARLVPTSDTSYGSLTGSARSPRSGW